LTWGLETLSETTVPYCGPAPDFTDLAYAWNLDPVLIAMIALATVLLFGTATRQGAFLQRAAIICILVVAFVSPLCALTTALFSARVFHHFILIAVLAPLLALNLEGRLPRSPWRLPALPEIPFLAHTIVYWAWHLPPGYSFALSNSLAYWGMQLALIVTAVWLWRTMLVSAGPGRRIALALATMAQMGFLAAILTFAPYPLFAEHLLTTESYGMTALEDQQLSGLIMWTFGLVPYLVVALSSVRTMLHMSAWRGVE